MKKLLIFLLIILQLFTVMACSKKEDNILVGTWIDKDRDTLTLKENGEYESTHYYDKEGTWKVEEDVLIFKTLFDKEKEIKYKIEEKEKKIYLIFIEKDLIFGGDKETKFVKEIK
ncbi:hypothetical protein [Tissierella pigra]|uniref:DUF5640 domain-containing protein n=1 Tax=Tissierella pigra TaxID=2607614 RepID=A0A6N7Y0Y7_9FIRM|nr:hypothetical protein [Tissierella pigra]MSU02158.1 hypothetical protein [Tissierella pigra]